MLLNSVATRVYELKTTHDDVGIGECPDTHFRAVNVLKELAHRGYRTEHSL